MQEFPNEDGGEMPVNRHFDYPQAPRKLDKSQKIAVTILGFFAILVMTMWIIQTKNSLTSPFGGDLAEETDDTCPDGNCDGVSSNADLKKKDTDKDGLSDYDELNIYSTSPYLEDSDSDGYSDQKEVTSQNDPSCPEGQECFVEPITDETKSTESLEKLIMPVTGAMTEGITPSAKEPVDMEETIKTSETVMNGTTDPTNLRKLLIQSGMDAEVLNQISDEELMASYQEMMAGQQ